MWTYNTDYLAHFGILGQKWGIRRYQNKDGSLTAAGRKRYGKMTDKYFDEMNKEVSSKDQDRFLSAYNKTADAMNNGLIDEYNAKYEKMLGEKAKNHDYGNDSVYDSGLDELFNAVFSKEYNKQLQADIEKTNSYKKAKELIDKYGTAVLSEDAKEAWKDYEDLVSINKKGGN